MAESPSLAHHLAVIAEAKDHLGDVPANLRAGLARYFDAGIEPGRFLVAVLENDLMGATVRCASYPIEECLRQLALFLFNHAPEGSHGSKEERLAWQAKVSALQARTSEPPPALDQGEAIGG